METGLPVLHTEKGQDHHATGISAGHGNDDADLSLHPGCYGNRKRQHQKALLGYFTINAKRLGSGISEDTVSQILAVDGLSGRHTLRSYSYAIYYDADRKPLEISTEGAAQVTGGICRTPVRSWRTPIHRRTAISPMEVLN